MTPLERLYEQSDLPRFGIPAVLASMYGGDFGLPRRRVVANFVSSTDGVVAFPDGGESGAIVSGNSEADRFVMGLLRACADAVLIGAGTFRRGRGSLWLPEVAFPDAAGAFAELRTQLGLRPRPLLVVVTKSGGVDPTEPALADALIATTTEEEARVRAAVQGGTRVLAFGSNAVALGALLDVLCQQGMERVLCEGGPSLFGELVNTRLVDELFLTVSPTLFGRSPSDGRKSLVEGFATAEQRLDLVSARRHGSHLFLRYAFSNAAPHPGSPPLSHGGVV